MTYSPMQSVTEFHDKFHRDGKGRHARPISVSTINHRLNLIGEEFEEVKEALLYIRATTNRNFLDNVEPERMPTGWSNLAKELADLLYVVYGTAEELGIPLEEIFVKVHESNMSKIWDDGTVHYNEFGKVLKPPTYFPPNLESILNAER